MKVAIAHLKVGVFAVLAWGLGSSLGFADQVLAQSDGWTIVEKIDPNVGNSCYVHKVSDRGRPLEMNFYDTGVANVLLFDPSWQIDTTTVRLFVDVGEKWGVEAISHGDFIEMQLSDEQSFRFAHRFAWEKRMTFRNKDNIWIDNFNISYDLSQTFYNCVLRIRRTSDPEQSTPNNPFN